MNNNNPQNKKLPPNLVLTAVLSGGLTIGLSLIYILLCIAFLLLRTNCSMGAANSTGADYFWRTTFRVYVLSNEACWEEGITVERLTSSSALLILVSVTLAVSVLCLTAAIALITIIQDEDQSQYINAVVYTYLGCCVASLAVDLATASHFGMDYSYITSLLKQLTAGSPSNYRTEVIRQGAFWLMTFALKGYFPLIINCIFLALLVTYAIEYQKASKKEEHSIHKLGVLNAFGRPRKPENNWSQSEIYNNSPFRGPHLNNAFVEDFTPPRSPMRPEPTRNDYNPKSHLNNAFVEDFTPPRSPMRPEPTRNDYNPNVSSDRSDSWHHARHNASPSARPFSYLEDIKRSMPPKLQPPTPEPQWRRDPMPAVDPSWRRDPWTQKPQVPEPDYSPNLPRRLKSALKPTY